MFSKNKAASDEFNGFLAQGTSLTGDLRFTGKLQLDGEFRGTISTSDILIIGEKATIEADIKAGEVQISGKVTGNIESARRVEISASGQVRGEVCTPKLVIHEGGVFEGRSLTIKIEDSQESLWQPDQPIGSIAQTSTT